MKKIFLALFTMLFVSTCVFAQSDLQVLAVVKYNKNETITLKQLKNEVKIAEKEHNRKLTLEERKTMLDSLINQKLVLQAAQKAGVSIPDSAVDAQFVATIAQRIGIPVQTEAQLEQIIMQNTNLSLDEFVKQGSGRSKKEFKEMVKNTAIIQQYIIYSNQEELQKVAPTDKQIRMFYEANKSNFVWKDMAELFVVVVPKGDNAGAAKIKAGDLRDQLMNKKTSKDQIKIQSKNGEAGYSVINDIFENTKPYADILGLTYESYLGLFQEKEGFVSDVFEYNDQYLVFNVVKKYGAKMLAISDIVRPGTTITVYDYIRAGLTQQLQGAFLQQALDSAIAELKTTDNVEMKKTGADLDKLLNWGD